MRLSWSVSKCWRIASPARPGSRASIASTIARCCRLIRSLELAALRARSRIACHDWSCRTRLMTSKMARKKRLPAQCAIWRCSAPSQSSCASASLPFGDPGDEFVHARNVGGLGTDRGKLRQLRLDAEPHFHHFQEVDLRKDGNKMGVQLVGSPADIGAGALTPPDQAFRFKDFKRASYRAASDIKSLGKRPFSRQLSIGARAQQFAQLFQRVGGILLRFVVRFGHGVPQWFEPIQNWYRTSDWSGGQEIFLSLLVRAWDLTSSPDVSVLGESRVARSEASATTVLPEPTSPWRSRCIGAAPAMSRAISAIAVVWSPVSANGSASRNAGTRAPSTRCRMPDSWPRAPACARRVRPACAGTRRRSSRRQAAARSAIDSGRWIARIATRRGRRDRTVEQRLGDRVGEAAHLAQRRSASSRARQLPGEHSAFPDCG